MRNLRRAQLGLFVQWPKHQLSEELKKIDEIIDRHPEFSWCVHADLVEGKTEHGDIGMTAEHVLKAAILKSIRGLSYRGLAFNIADSASSRAFLGFELEEQYGHSCLQDNISRISEQSWQMISSTLVDDAKKQKIESGKEVRMDSTATDSNIHHPTDASLLYDCIRVAERDFKKVRKKAIKKHWRLISKKKVKRAKTLIYKINNSKNDGERLPYYKELLKISTELKKELPGIIHKIEKECIKKEGLKRMLKQLKNVDFYLVKIIFQATKRVIERKKVSSKNKVVSIFEPHTDIIVKGQREVQFGHKIFLASGKSNLVLDCQIPEGNPADSDMFLNVLNSIDKSYGIYPRKISADGGFASKNNLKEAKDVCFPEKAGMKVSQMVKSSWVFKRLLNWRAGIEAIVSFLKRCFGMRIAMWRGFNGFKRYVRSAVCLRWSPFMGPFASIGGGAIVRHLQMENTRVDSTFDGVIEDIDGLEGWVNGDSFSDFTISNCGTTGEI